MKASVVDMRYKMSEVLSALDRNESVEILYHGKIKGIIKPVVTKGAKKVKEHRFFGMHEETEETVESSMENLRGGDTDDFRYRYPYLDSERQPEGGRLEDQFCRKVSFGTLAHGTAARRGRRKQHHVIKEFLKTFGFQILPLSENIGYRASVYIEEYSLSSGLRAGDAIIAATAVENSMVLATGNRKHFKPIKDLSLRVFRP